MDLIGLLEVLGDGIIQGSLWKRSTAWGTYYYVIGKFKLKGNENSQIWVGGKGFVVDEI